MESAVSDLRIQRPHPRERKGDTRRDREKKGPGVDKGQDAEISETLEGAENEVTDSIANSWGK